MPACALSTGISLRIAPGGAVCGLRPSCATCHGYVDARWAAELPPKSETEVFMLEGVPELRENSRLCCQIRMKPELDGIVVVLPDEQV